MQPLCSLCLCGELTTETQRRQRWHREESLMSNVTIRCEGLSKSYRIGAAQEGYKALRDVIADAATAPFRRIRNGHENSNGHYIWALDDISFEINSGDLVGIVGRNGAGKSTLLRILSRITKPTRGRAEVHGRVGSS